MYYYDLFMQGPAVYIPVLLISLAITMLAYGAFPVIFSKVRKRQITKKKFILLCYGVNLLVMIVFIAFGSKSSGAPYMLWTWIFSSAGVRKLDTRAIFNSNNKSQKQECIVENYTEGKNGNAYEPSNTKQKQPKSLTSVVIDIVNILVVILILILSVVGHDIASSCYGDNYEAIFLIGIAPIVLRMISVISRKNNIAISIGVIISYFLMMFNSVGFDDGTNYIIALCLLYLIAYELYTMSKTVIKKYYTTQKYKIKCYKRIEEINTYREKGIITEDEYEKAREQIMSKIQY